MAHTWNRSKLHFVDDILNSTWILTAGHNIILKQGDMPDTQKLITKLKEISALSVDASNCADNIMAKFSSQPITTASTTSALRHPRSPLSEWEEGVPRDKSLKEGADLNQWLRDSVTSTMALSNLGSISKWKVYCTTWGDNYNVDNHDQVYNYNVDNHDQVHKLLAEMMEIKSWKNIST